MAKKTDGWMPLYVADYLADTSRLTTEQHGAYFLIIMDYWRNGPPPDDDVVLASITKLSTALWKKHASSLRVFFQQENGLLRHKRIDEERQKAAEISAKRTVAATNGAAKRWGSQMPIGMPNAMPNAMPEAKQTPWQNDAPSHTHTPNTNTSLGKPTLVAKEGMGLNTHKARVCVEAQGDQTSAGSACLAMKAQGVSDVSPSHPKLTALLAAGATEDELAGAAKVAAERGKGFAYALGMLERQRVDAAAMVGALHSGPIPTKADALRARNRATMTDWMSTEGAHDANV